MDPPLLAAAVELAALGWPMFFIRPRDKQPFARTGGFKDATTDEQTLRDTFKRRRGRVNLAVATGHPGPTVLDIDSPEHTAARALIAGLNGIIPPTVATVRGRHLFFAGTSASTIGLDYGELRSVGSYVVVPPSIHPDGREYVWLQSPSSALPPLPAMLAGLARTSGAGRGELEPLERIPHGQRHEKLKDFAIHLLRGGITDQGVIAEQLEAHFRARFDPEPPPRKGEFRDLARWAVGSDMAERERAAAAETTETKPKLKPKRKTGLELWPPAGDAPLAEHRDYVRVAGGWSDRIDIKDVRRYGTRGVDGLEIRLSNGQWIVFDRQDRVTTRGYWLKIITSCTHGVADPVSLSDWEAGKVFRSLCLLAAAPPEQREQEELDDTLRDFLALVEPSTGHDPSMSEGRFDAMAQCHGRPEYNPRDRTLATQPVLLIAVDGSRYVRAGELRDYLNHRGLGISAAAFPGRMQMAGLERQVWNGRRSGGKKHMTFYRLPDD